MKLIDINDKFADGKLICIILLIAILTSLTFYWMFEKVDEIVDETDLYEANIVEVVDGDTIWVEVDGEELKVRLIGVNAPESVHMDAEQNSEYGKMASEFTKDFLEDYTTVYLQYDEDRQDQYERELCYVWLKEDVDTQSKDDISTYMFNSILIDEGYAADAAYEPNTSYADYFKKLCQAAKAADRGLWKYEGFELEVSP